MMPISIEFGWKKMFVNTRLKCRGKEWNWTIEGTIVKQIESKSQHASNNIDNTNTSNVNVKVKASLGRMKRQIITKQDTILKKKLNPDKNKSFAKYKTGY